MLTVNPFTDPITRHYNAILESQLYSELRKYRGAEPSVNDLRASEEAIKKVLYQNLLAVANASLVDGAKEVSVADIPVSVNLNIMSDARTRSATVAHQVMQVTGLSFGILYAVMSKEQVSGKERAKKIAKHETSRIFFESRRKGWGLRHGVKKSWYTQSGNVCELCQENEDDGAIPVDAAFSSGDFAPPIHINCECLMSLII